MLALVSVGSITVALEPGVRFLLLSSLLHTVFGIYSGQFFCTHVILYVKPDQGVVLGSDNLGPTVMGIKFRPKVLLN